MKSALTVLLIVVAIGCTSESGSGNSSFRVDFSGKSYRMYIEDKGEPNFMKDVELQAIFNNDTTGIFRTKKGGVLRNDNFFWRYVGDSLRVKREDKIPEGEEKYAYVYQSRPMMYAVIKQGSDYLLIRKKDRLLLSPIK